MRFLICCPHEARRRAETLAIVTFGLNTDKENGLSKFCPFFLLRDFALYYGQKRHVPATTTKICENVLHVIVKHPNMCAFKQLTVAKD